MPWLTSARECFILQGRRRRRKTCSHSPARAIEKAAQAAIRADAEKFESITQDWGYRLGSQIYDVYLAGKVKPRGLRRLFLAHLDEPGLARKVCTAVIARVDPPPRAHARTQRPALTRLARLNR